MFIRVLEEADNAAIEKVIRECLIEFGGNREGLAWADDSMSNLYGYYGREGRAYWVALQNGEIVGGCGIAEFGDNGEVCELQKMYLLPRARGTGIARELLEKALAFAKMHYKLCYLETLSNMIAAGRFYEKNGFKPLDEPLDGSEHFACDAWYLREL
ncbi:GNAT family N-acetyltransferase [Paenibacillus soyae]|uniref:GNAT family N-acetyltransferase n=1 Tax=Paenibacillus soyae TaxID=2969249 RepID=A0A9X2MN32_9BACL|nr:GNAT family N-acetyltransferase [Paenibacillus soyae]MCR2802743.1 GNAT family N-acetyltransferase [Paenibacillus soyae]